MTDRTSYFTPCTFTWDNYALSYFCDNGQHWRVGGAFYPRVEMLPDPNTFFFSVTTDLGHPDGCWAVHLCRESWKGLHNCVARNIIQYMYIELHIIYKLSLAMILFLIMYC